MDKHRNSLQPGYKLHWYHIIKILGHGGFGITYLAHDTNLDQQVAINPAIVPGDDKSNVEKTVLLDSEEKPEGKGKKKPRSLLGRLIKWTAIIFVVLLVLAILSDDEKQKNVVEPDAIDSKVVDQVIDVPEEPFASDVPAGTDKVISDVQSESQIISDLLDGARSNIGELKLTSPLGNNAYEKYQTVLNLEPNNPEALNGLDRIVDEYIDLMDFALGKMIFPGPGTIYEKG